LRGAAPPGPADARPPDWFVSHSFLMLLLSEHPEVLVKAQHEIDTVVGQHRLIEQDDIERLPYCRAVIKEVLRLKPIVPFPYRLAGEDTTLGGYDIPKGTWVFPNLSSCGMSEEFWGKDQHQFRPERFLDNTEFNVGSAKEAGWMPFGGGTRMCLGWRLAQFELYHFAFSIMQCFDIVNPKPENPHRSRQMLVGISLHPKDSSIILRPRPALTEFLESHAKA